MRFDLVLGDRKSYTYEGYSAKCVAAQLEKKNIPFKIIYLSDGIFNDYLRFLQNDPPTSMINFIDLFQHDYPFCDMVQVPQFFWTQHSISEAAHFLNSQYGKIGLPQASPFPQTVVLSSGVENTSKEKPIFDTVFFSPLVDLDDLEKIWEDFYPQNIIALLKKIIQTEVTSEEIIKTFKTESLSLILRGVERYRKAKRAYEIISTFEGGYLDVFGEHIGNNWLKRLPNAKWIRLHYKLPYIEHLEVLKKSKQVIIDPLEPHWIAPAIAYGCELIGGLIPPILPKSWEEQTTKLVDLLHVS